MKRFKFLEEEFKDYNIIEFNVELTPEQEAALKQQKCYSSIPGIWNVPNEVTEQVIDSALALKNPGKKEGQ